MPPLPRLRIAAIDELERQLRFAPPETARRQLERVESLCSEIEADRTYPEEWVVFRITGYRIDKPAQGRASESLLVGRALIGDLVSLIERLSVTAGVTETELHSSDLAPATPGNQTQCTPQTTSSPAWISALAVCERWKISRKTLDRYRKEGLPARRVATASSRSKLYFRIDAVERFERLHARKLAEASAFSRIEPALEQKLLRMARRYHERLGWSLNQTAKRLAERYGRGHETVRSLLQRHDIDSTRKSQPAGRVQPGQHRPVFDNRGALTAKQQRVIERATSRGIEVERLAKHFGKTRPSIYRALAMARANRLRSLTFSGSPSSDTANRPTAHSLKRTRDPLTEPAATTGLGGPSPRTLGELMAYAHRHPTPDAVAERVRAGALAALTEKAVAGIASLSPHHPTPGRLDEIETMLRWASRLKAELVRSQLSLLLKTISGQLGKELAILPRSSSISLLDECLVALFDAVDRFDPRKGGRLAAPCGLVLSRVVSLWQRRTLQAQPASSKALAYTNPDQVELDDWTRRVSPWQLWLEPSSVIRERLLLAPPRAKQLLEQRYGWSGSPPITLAAVASMMGMTVHHASALERRTCVELRRSVPVK